MKLQGPELMEYGYDYIDPWLGAALAVMFAIVAVVGWAIWEIKKPEKFTQDDEEHYQELRFFNGKDERPPQYPDWQKRL